MTVVADLPDSARLLAGPGRFRGRDTALTGESTAYWLVPMADYADFKRVCLFTPGVITIPGGTITRNIPLQSKWDPSQYATGVDYEAYVASKVDPAVDPDPAKDWEKLLVAVTFQQPTYPVEGARPYVEIQTDGSIQDATIPNHPYKFAGTSELISQDVAVPWAVIRKNILWHQISDPDAAEAVVGPLCGSVNDAGLVIGGITWPADTVHFQTYSIRQTFLTSNERNASFSMALSIRPVPTWQQAMKKDGTYGNVESSTGGNPPLPRANLTAILNGYP